METQPDEQYFAEMNRRESYPQAIQGFMHTFLTTRLVAVTLS
jgi:hypothetical protein